MHMIISKYRSFNIVKMSDVGVYVKTLMLIYHGTNKSPTN